MNEGEYLMLQQHLGILAGFVTTMNLEGFVKAGSHANEIGVFMDPTLWMKGHNKLDVILKFARAALVFKGAAVTFVEELKAFEPQPAPSSEEG